MYLVSASPEDIVLPLAEHLGVDGAIASRVAVDEEGRYAGEMEFYAYGPFKAEAMQELAEAEGIDLASHRPTRTPTPTSPCSRRSAIRWPSTPTGCWPRWPSEREWEVMQFTKPIRLRDRVSVPRLSITTAAAGVTAAASVGALVAWRLARRTAL